MIAESHEILVIIGSSSFDPITSTEQDLTLLVADAA
jgi:hypothetical protein